MSNNHALLQEAHNLLLSCRQFSDYEWLRNDIDKYLKKLDKELRPEVTYKFKIQQYIIQNMFSGWEFTVAELSQALQIPPAEVLSALYDSEDEIGISYRGTGLWIRR